MTKHQLDIVTAIYTLQCLKNEPDAGIRRIIKIYRENREYAEGILNDIEYREKHNLPPYEWEK